jgi:hypothetical protein
MQFRADGMWQAKVSCGNRVPIIAVTSLIRGETNNFARVHQTHRVTPAMEAGIADHVWSIEEIVSLLG